MIINTKNNAHEIRPDDLSNYITDFPVGSVDFISFTAYKTVLVPCSGCTEDELYDKYREITPQQFDDYTKLKNLCIHAAVDNENK